MIYYLILLFGIDVIFQNIKLFRAVNYLNLLRRKKKDDNGDDFVATEILLPVFNEQAIISDTINFFNKLSLNKAIKVVIIGSSREVKGASSTLGVASAYSIKRGLKNINLELSLKSGSKATQLNYYTAKSRGKNIWYFIFDADSRPEEDFIKSFYAINPDINTIYQMPSNYLNNVQNDSSIVRDALAINQTIFSIGVEFYNSMSTRLLRNLTPSSLIGHGLIINQKLLDEIGGFPDPIEDSRLANLASLKNIKIKFLPIFDFGMVPGSLKVAIKQYSGWFYGQTFIFKDMKVIFIKRYPFRVYSNFFYRLFINLYWLLKTPFILMVLTWLLFLHKYELLVVFVLLIILNHLKIFYLNKIISGKRLGSKHMIRSVVWDFIYSLGPLLFLVKLLRRFLVDSRIEFLPKTEKDKSDLHANN